MHRYTPAGGLPALKEAIVAKTARDSGLSATAANVLVTNGGKQAVYEALATMLDPGDEVLLPAPFWTTYPEAIRLAGGVPVPVVADEQSGYLVSVGQLEAARTPRTKVLLFCSPSNPTGAVYPAEQVEEIGRWALDAGLWVLTDEIYEHLTYGGVSAPSMPVLVPELADRCVVVNGVAKTYAMTGWRVGWIARPRGRGEGGDQPPVARDVQRRQRVAGRRDRRADRRPVGRRHHARGVRPAPADHRGDAARDPGHRLPRAAGRVLRLPVGQGPARAARSPGGPRRAAPSSRS